MRIKCTIILMVLTMALYGCGAKSKMPQFNAQYYPQCYDPINKLCQDQDNSSEIKGAALGGLLGAAGGALAGGLIKGDVKGALIGGAVGAAAGASIGFFKARLDKIKDRDQRLAEYQKILGENSANWDIERASVEKAYQCYREQIKLLKQQAKDKRISKEEFMARMNEIKAGVDNINTYWANAQTRMDSRIADGEAFLAQQEAEDKKLAAAQQKAAQRQLQAQRKSTQAQRSKKDSDVAKIDNLKNATTSEWDELYEEMKISREFA